MSKGERPYKNSLYNLSVYLKAERKSREIKFKITRIFTCTHSCTYSQT